MKNILAAMALTVALPGIAFAQTAEKPKACCCDKKDGEKACCDKAKEAGDKKAGHEHPAEHDMSKM